MVSSSTSATNSLPRLSASAVSGSQGSAMMNMHKAHSMYHFFPQHTGVKSARYRPPGFARNSGNAASSVNSKRAFSAPGLQISGSQSSIGKRERETSRSRRQQTMAIPTGNFQKLFQTFERYFSKDVLLICYNSEIERIIKVGNILKFQ